jgi:hypothetical protein
VTETADATCSNITEGWRVGMVGSFAAGRV